MGNRDRHLQFQYQLLSKQSEAIWSKTKHVKTHRQYLSFLSLSLSLPPFLPSSSFPSVLLTPKLLSALACSSAIYLPRNETCSPADKDIHFHRLRACKKQLLPALSPFRSLYLHDSKEGGAKRGWGEEGNHTASHRADSPGRWRLY